MQYEITVTLKDDVLDPEARALLDALKRQGYETVQGVQVAKKYILAFADKSQDHLQDARQIADKILANPAAQSFQVRPLP